jgi:hypothetical protein
MPLGQPMCPRCHVNIFVRTEKIFSGRRIIRAYYCGRCDEGWQVESQPPSEIADRRQGQRRQERLDERIDGLKKTVASASLNAKSDRRNAR